MKVIKDMDKRDRLQAIENALIKGHVIRGITDASEFDPDLFCVCRNARMVRDLVDSILIK